ncbi:GGDEF domain-containing protein [Metasolibacillus sp.]|uniref:GGDEF domain-containing protein n=1 Tax=Metasolibacillus sp. TaxID=2703680 RepID=UPI0025E1AF6A|nr:GGDEF domain-containing protein [Metasolibacillus sp.]MCT6923900.1 GGDEF domain-containing protein [Metasolibacillus sp.]MCT6940438.1 GGDEF domain-containing protein [Metasolibacillus sp.]
MELDAQQIDVKFTMHNLQRAKYCAATIIILEVLLAIVHIARTKTIGDGYFLLYIMLLVLSILFLILVSVIEKRFFKYRYIKTAVWGYYWFVLMWGVSIALLDQRSYGQVTAYLISLLAVTMLYHVRLRKFILLQSFPTVYLMSGLMLMQQDSERALTHLVNIVLFIVISAIGSRFLYYGQYKMLAQEQLNSQLVQMNGDLQLLATYDELTEMPNRRGLYDYVQANMRDIPRHVTAMILDIDAFKQFNDYYGHLEGDKVLKEIAVILRALASNRCFVGRFGGEEFIYLIFDMEHSEALHFANNICKAVEQRRIPHQASPFLPYVTVSIGVATDPCCTIQNLQQLFQNADAALYSAKRAGRNRAELTI